MLKTHGKDWLSELPGDAVWCKVITRPEELDLRETGGFAIQAPFVTMERAVWLDEHSFLLVVCRRHVVENRTEYISALCQGVLDPVTNKPKQITDEMVVESLQRALRLNLVPEHKRYGSATNNVAYRAAIHCLLYYTDKGMHKLPGAAESKEVPDTSAPVLPATIKEYFAPAKQRRRRVERLNAGEVVKPSPPVKPMPVITPREIEHSYADDEFD